MFTSRSSSGNRKGIQRILFSPVLITTLFFSEPIKAQGLQGKADAFFLSDTVLEVILETDLHQLSHERKKEKYQAAYCKINWGDGTVTFDTLAIKPRGYNRMEQCVFPPITLNFKKSKDSALRSLETLKLVIPCSRGVVSEQLVFREYLVYKMYNLLTEKSFRSRLVRFQLTDPSGRTKAYTGHAFFLEDENKMAGRNKCYSQKRAYKPEQLDKQQLAFMYLFQYMIGNTDFTVEVNKNIKTIKSFQDASLPPYVVPYDFDYSGMVHAGYSMPHPDYQDKIRTVMDRLYLGPAIERKMLDTLLLLFEKSERMLFSLIDDFPLLNEHSKKEMSLFLKEFYKDIRQPNRIRETFLTGSIYR